MDFTFIFHACLRWIVNNVFWQISCGKKGLILIIAYDQVQVHTPIPVLFFYVTAHELISFITARESIIKNGKEDYVGWLAGIANGVVIRGFVEKFCVLMNKEALQFLMIIIIRLLI